MISTVASVPSGEIVNLGVPAEALYSVRPNAAYHLIINPLRSGFSTACDSFFRVPGGMRSPWQMLPSSMLLLNLILLIEVTFSTPTPDYNRDAVVVTQSVDFAS